MEKISSILPSSSRVAAVDLKDSQPVRPGAPAFGRPMGSSALAERDVATTAEKAVAVHHQQMRERMSEREKAQMVDEMARQFFINQATSSAEKPIKDIDVNWNLDQLRTSQPVNHGVHLPTTRAASTIESEAEPTKESDFSAEQVDEEYDYVPPGSYLNVVA